jgi:hypothetical protein
MTIFPYCILEHWSDSVVYLVFHFNNSIPECQYLGQHHVLVFEHHGYMDWMFES